MMSSACATNIDRSETCTNRFVEVAAKGM